MNDKNRLIKLEFRKREMNEPKANSIMKSSGGTG